MHRLSFIDPENYFINPISYADPCTAIPNFGTRFSVELIELRDINFITTITIPRGSIIYIFTSYNALSRNYIFIVRSFSFLLSLSSALSSARESRDVSMSLAKTHNCVLFLY